VTLNLILELVGFRSDLSFCKPGYLDNALDFENIDGGYSSDFAVLNCCAHMICTVNKIDSDTNATHHLLYCHIEEAYCHPKYWNGKQFCPTENDESPHHLSFLGSQQFAANNTIL
jgi:hypothetical protein